MIPNLNNVFTYGVFYISIISLYHFMIYNIEKYFKNAGKLFKIPELGQNCVNLGISYIQLIKHHIISFRFVGFL